MEIVKKNLISLICAVIAIAALVAVFVWPLDGFFESLKDKATKRAAVLARLNSLKNRPRVVPVIDVSGQIKPLLKFPSKVIIGLGDSAQKKMRQQSEEMYAYAWKLNQKGHALVVPDTLPVMLNQSVAYSFRKNLLEALAKLRDDLAAGIPPTPDQIKLREDALRLEMDKDLIMVNGMPTNKEVVDARYEAEKLKLPEIMKKEMASKYKMYIDPSKVFVASSKLPPDSSPTPAATWWSQVNYWVYSDVVATIKEINADSSSVLDSPIKNLVVLDVPDEFFPSIASSMGPRIGEIKNPDAPTSATGGRPDPTIPLPDSGASTPTKRASNNLFDVLQFKMKIDIEADKIPLFLKTLATNRFITVTRVEMNPVDSQAMQATGYVYGPRPVVTLDLDCEALFMREWTIPWMPQIIRDALGIPDTTAKP